MSNPDESFRKSLNENIRSLMELMHVPWSDIMEMNYTFFIDTLKWKIELEKEKKKQINEELGKKRIR